MQTPSLAFGALVGGLTSMPLIALTYLARQLIGTLFFPFDLFDWLARVLPGDVVTRGIEVVVGVIRTLDLGSTSEAAKQIERLAALGIVALGAATVGIGVVLTLRRTEGPGWRIGAAAGFVVFLFITAVEFNLQSPGQVASSLTWLALLTVGWGASLGALCQGLAYSDAAMHEDRRAVVAKIAGGTLGLALAAWGLGHLAERLAGGRQSTAGMAPPSTGSGTPQPDRPIEPATSFKANPTVSPGMRERVMPAPGTRPEITPEGDFYRIDINLQPVEIETGDWQLNVAGLFDTPRLLNLSDLMAYPAVTRPATLSCISNPIGGDLIDTTYWTGVRLPDLLDDLGLQPEATHLFVVAADSFYETLPVEDMLDPHTLLVYGMNGRTLSAEHGYPLRIYIPNRYGMKQPKWIIRLEATDRDRSGYWVDRGWSKAARPQIISIIDTAAVDSIVDGKAPIGGIAWAGGRGIRSVEVQVDDGAWTSASLRTPPLSSLTWVQWRYDWPVVPGRHTIRVRATDGTGTLQVEETSKGHPDGATGYHTLTVEV